MDYWLEFKNDDEFNFALFGSIAPPSPSPNQCETQATVMWSRLRGFHDDGYLRMRPDWKHKWQCWTCRRVRVYLS